MHTILLLLLLSSVCLGLALLTAYYLTRDRKRLLENSFIMTFKQSFKLDLGQQFENLFKEIEDLTPTEYVLVQAIIVLTSVVIALNSEFSFFKILLVAEGLLHTWIFYKIQSFRKELKSNLCIIQETMYYQSDIGTPLSETLSYAAKMVTYPMDNWCNKLAASYSFKQNFEMSIDDLREISSVRELQSFSNILSHHIQTGNTAEAHEAALRSLLELKRGELLIKRRSNRFFVQCAFGMLFVSAIIVLAVPNLLEAYDLFKSAFRP